MFTKQQLAKWKSEGFPFPPEYDEWAVEAEPIDPSIYNVSVLKSDKKNEGRNFNFILKIDLNVPTYFDYSIEINIQDGSANNVYQKQGSFNNSTYYSEAKIAMSIMFSEKVFDVSVLVRKNKLTQYDTGKVISTRSFKVLVRNNGDVLIFNGSDVSNKSASSEKKVTFEEMQQVFSSADDEIVKIITDAFNEGVEMYKIDNCLRKAHFFAQALKEVGSGLKIHTAEIMDYRTDALIEGWWYSKGKKANWVKGNKDERISGYYTKGTKSTVNFSYTKKHHDIAELYGRKDLNRYGDGGIQAANQEMIANYVYSNKFENGDPESGDGSKFRGKGLIQLTWRENYRKVNTLLQELDKEIDIINDPNSILQPRIAVLSAMAFWKWKKINDKIGTDKAPEITNKVSGIVNPGEGAGGWKKRLDLYKDVTKEIFKVDDCKLK